MRSLHVAFHSRIRFGGSEIETHSFNYEFTKEGSATNLTISMHVPTREPVNQRVAGWYLGTTPRRLITKFKLLVSIIGACNEKPSSFPATSPKAKAAP